jgi:PHP family Zn ribbon phosphoesterase
MRVLTEAAAPDIAAVAGELVAEGVLRARRGEVVVSPGYDGEYGAINLW